MARPFRTPESFDFERRARELIAPLLEARGFEVVRDQRTKWGNATSQTVFARLPGKDEFGFRVRLCWRREGRNRREELYSAAQLTARLFENDWETTVKKAANRGQIEGVKHTLFIQADRNTIVHALAVPSIDIWPIWQKQREISAEIIKKGLTGRISKNHAENGDSPTIWLQDDRTEHTHRVADVIWQWPSALDILKMPLVLSPTQNEDVFDDLDDLGGEGGHQGFKTTSVWKRDPKVRQAVRIRANGKCERQGCAEQRDFPSFLDVHHILGIQESDRPWTCVALCPNCHREAHFSPEADALNNELLEFAKQFKFRS